MPTISVQIKNLPQIKAAFRQAPILMARELNDAINRSLLTIGSKATMDAPKDTSLMASSILSPTGVTRSGNTAPAGLVLSTPKSLRGSVGPSPFYSIYVHQGTRFMRGRPFLFNAVRTVERSIDDFFTKAVERVMNRIARESQ